MLKMLLYWNTFVENLACQQESSYQDFSKHTSGHSTQVSFTTLNAVLSVGITCNIDDEELFWYRRDNPPSQLSDHGAIFKLTSNKSKK